MSTRNTARKAGVLVPLAVLSAGWTTMLASAGAGAASDEGSRSAVTPPLEAIEAPASVGQLGTIAPAAPLATPRRVSSVSTDGIPAVALAAYQRAAQVIGSADPGCHVPWSLVAAIGRVESDHGRFGGNVLSDKGVATPGIFGIPLNGSRGTARVDDSDAGVYDGDATLDRAVGPMQFIPSTWQVVSVDGDGDGKRNPQDIDDAALATAVYLCSGKDDLATEAGVTNAVFRYNHSHDYVSLVKSIADRYGAGTFNAVATRTYGVTTLSSARAAAPDPVKAAAVRSAAPSVGVLTTPKPPKPQAPAPHVAVPVKPADPKKSKDSLSEAMTQTLTGVEQTTAGLLGTVGGLFGSLLGKP